eukprot:jgi/Hompol1/2222/HPOL_002144-RA
MADSRHLAIAHDAADCIAALALARKADADAADKAMAALRSCEALLRTLEQQLETACIAKQKAQMDHQTQAQAHSRLAEDCLLLRSHAASLQLALDTDRAALSDRDATIASLKALNTHLQLELRNSTEKAQALSAIRSENANLARENDRLRRELQHLRLLNHDQQKQIDVLLLKAAASSSTAAPQPTVPHSEPPSLLDSRAMNLSVSECSDRNEFLEHEARQTGTMLQHLQEHVDSLERQLLDKSVL